MTLAPSLRALITELIDYAGLFPPATLPLDEALANYARFRTQPEQWMLARFVLPVAQLDALTDARLVPYRAATPLPLSLLGAAHRDASAIAGALARHGGRVVADALESRLAEDDVAARLDTDRAALAAQGLAMRCFYELPFDAGWAAWLPAAIAALAEARASGADVGVKLRCGGVTADAFPSVAQLADALCRCRDAALPMKFTAGLHHPLPRYDGSTGATMHGFFNVFTAGMAAHVHGLDAAALHPILAERDATAFRFDNQALHWRALAIPVPTITALRRSALLSYGSCSFDEPREDLQALGLLPTV